MLDPFAQLLQHCWGDAHALHMISLTNTRDGATLLAVVAYVFTLLPTRTQQLSTLLAQECRELLQSFARGLKWLKSIFTHVTSIYANLWEQKKLFT